MHVRTVASPLIAHSLKVIQDRKNAELICAEMLPRHYCVRLLRYCRSRERVWAQALWMCPPPPPLLLYAFISTV